MAQSQSRGSVALASGRGERPQVREPWLSGPGTWQGQELPSPLALLLCIQETAASWCRLGDQCGPSICQDPTGCILGLTRVHGGLWPSAPALVCICPQNASHIPTFTWGETSEGTQSFTGPL